MVISAINALTPEPGALRGAAEAGRARDPRADALRHGARIDATRDGYAAVVRRLIARSRSSAWPLLAAVAVGDRRRLFQRHADRLPARSEDQGAFFVEVAPARGRLGQPHRRERARRSRPMLRDAHGDRGRRPRSPATASSTASPSRTAPSLIVTLKPFDERTAPGASRSTPSIRDGRSRSSAIREAQVFAFNLPPIIGLGTGSAASSTSCSISQGRDVGRARRRSCAR